VNALNSLMRRRCRPRLLCCIQFAHGVQGVGFLGSCRDVVPLECAQNAVPAARIRASLPCTSLNATLDQIFRPSKTRPRLTPVSSLEILRSCHSSIFIGGGL